MAQRGDLQPRQNGPGSVHTTRNGVTWKLLRSLQNFPSQPEVEGDSQPARGVLCLADFPG